MKNSNKKSRHQKHQNSNKKKSIRSLTQKKLILKGGGPHMDKLLTPEFENDYEEFNSYLESGGAFVEDGQITPEFGKIRNKYFTRTLLSELTDNGSSTNEYVKNNSPFFKKIFNFKNIVYNYDLESITSLINPYRFPYLQIVKLLINKRNCSLKEYMLYNEEFDIDECINYGLYRGACGYPTLLSSLKSHTETVDKIEFLFRLIQTKLKLESKIGIIIGSIHPNEFHYDYDVNLYFNRCLDTAWTNEKCNEFKDIDTIIEEIQTQPLKKNYLILNFFPLNTHPSHMPLLNLIVDLMNNYHIYLINNMCMTCFGSFYYLKSTAAKRSKLKFQYKNHEPFSESSLKLWDPDNLDIQNCFAKSS